MRLLDYIIRFPTRLLFKLCFGDFRIFLRLLSLFTIFARQKPSENHHKSLKVVWYKPNLILLFKIHVNVFDKFVFYITYCKLQGIFCLIKFSNFSNLLIWILNCSKCTKKTLKVPISCFSQLSQRHFWKLNKFLIWHYGSKLR